MRRAGDKTAWPGERTACQRFEHDEKSGTLSNRITSRNYARFTFIFVASFYGFIKMLEEQKMYFTALDSINKGERERESLNRRLAERQCKLTVYLMILHRASYLASLMCRKRCKNCSSQKKNARLRGTKLLKASFFLTNNRKKSKSCVTR